MNATEQNALIFAQEEARTYSLAELYDPRMTFVRLCANVQEMYSLPDAALFRIVAQALREERARRRKR